MNIHKTIYLVIILFAISFNVVFGQILNNSFENWDSFGNPTNWITSEIPGSLNSITQSNDAQNGQYSVKIEVMDFFGVPYSGNLQSIDTANTYGHPISSNYSNLSGYYKFVPKGSAELFIVAGVYDEASQLIGVGGYYTGVGNSSWQQFNVPLDYYMQSTAASILITISVIDTSDPGPDLNTIGAYALIDNLQLGNPTSVNDNGNLPQSFTLSQNYPNPFNPTTSINYTVPLNGKDFLQDVKLKIYDILGREVATLVNQRQKPGFYTVHWNASNQPSGIYFYQFTAKNYTVTKKMTLLK
ncbi:MAG: T9SS type A sorting domain-containing protein [Ignavibacteriae bacterium]|nr:T9SS type A sorting domain-containing protein [Ignavibacteriota bacterium]